MDLIRNGVGNSKQPGPYHLSYEEVEILSKTESSTELTNPGTVYLVKRVLDNCYFVCRRIRLTDMNPQEREDVNKEVPVMLVQVALMQNMRHPNIVKLFQVVHEGEFLYCVQEFCEEGDLNHHIKRQSKKGEFFSQQIVESWVLQVLLALEYIHNMKIVHRDIKASNVFLTSTGNIKIGSFKLSKTLQTDRFATTFAGTPSYMSPEILENRPYDFKTDIWSLGCLIFELCALRPAFSPPNLLQLASKIIKGEPEGSIPSHYTKNLSDVIKKCLLKKPSDRPSAKQLLRSQYFLNVMQRFINKSGLVSEKEQKIPIKKFGIHKKLNDNKNQKVPKTPSTSGLSKRKVPTSQLAIESKSEKKSSAKKSVDRKGPITPIIEGKSELSKQSKELRKSRSQDRRKSMDKIKKPVHQKQIITTPNVGKVEGKKVSLPTIPKPSSKKHPQLAKSHDISKEFEQVSRAVNSEIQSPSKQYEDAPEQNEEKQTKTNWIDTEDIDYTISMTKKNLAAELQNFRKKDASFDEQNLPHENSSGQRNIFESLVIREDDDTELEQMEQTDIDANRLTMTGDELPELLTQYKNKMQEVIQELNYRYGPNMEIIIERTNEFGSDQFAKQKPLDTSES